MDTDKYLNRTSFKFPGINSALAGMAKELLDHGTWRENNGFQKNTSASCLEFPYPVTIEITHPEARHVLFVERHWSRILPYAESLWLALGWNNLDDLTGRYIKNLYNFSDDGVHWRAGYGGRIRSFTGVTNQYRNGKTEDEAKEEPLEIGTVDQLKYVIETLRREPTSRQALITIHDPVKDSQLELVTKDQPCTRSLHFMIVDGKLNCYVYMRSNDLISGFSAVNIFNFTFMQEYIAGMLGVPVGSYFHLADNLHCYEKDFKILIELSQETNDICEKYDSLQFKEFEYKEGFKYTYPGKYQTDLKETSYEDFIKNLEKIYYFSDKFYNMNKNQDLSLKEVEEVLKELLTTEWLGNGRKFYIRWTLEFANWGKRFKPLFNEWVLSDLNKEKNIWMAHEDYIIK